MYSYNDAPDLELQYLGLQGGHDIQLSDEERSQNADYQTYLVDSTSEEDDQAEPDYFEGMMNRLPLCRCNAGQETDTDNTDQCQDFFIPSDQVEITRRQRDNSQDEQDHGQVTIN
jgi:hypothetical protein